MDKKCRNCFKESVSNFCSGDCREQYEKKYFPNLSSGDGSKYKTLSQLNAELPTENDIKTGSKYPKLSDLMNSESKPTYRESLESLPTFEELQFGRLLD
jgi:hypothetical protein